MSFSNGETMRRKAQTGPGASLPLAPASETPPTAEPIAVPVAPYAAADAGQAFMGASARVAEAEFQAEQARGHLATAESKQAEINGRIATLEREKSEIINRRTAGQHEPDDAARVSLLDADLQGLYKLLHDAAAATALAMTEVNNTDHTVVLARQHLQLAEDEHAHALLSQHADVLSRLLLQTASRLSVIEARLDTSTKAVWSAPRQLINELRQRALVSRKGW